MTAQREDTLKPAWVRDRLDSSHPPEIEAAYFDTDLQAWVLSRHEDVLAAFQTPSLIPGRRDIANVSLESEENARLAMREEVRNVLCPSHVRAWRDKLRTDAEDLCSRLSTTEPVDLLANYARPLCLSFAAVVTGIAQTDADRLEKPAQIVSASTAEPENQDLLPLAKAANATLRPYFNAGPESLRDPGFVGLSQTLLRMVITAWYALVRFPEQWSLLRSSPQLIPQAMEELLRYAGVVRILSRTATEDICLNGASIRKGDQVLLRIFAANHDPDRFFEPEKLNFTRRDPGHFAFGAGGHACVAASLIRTAAIMMTVPLLTQFDSVQLALRVEWHGGSLMRSPVSLCVILRRSSTGQRVVRPFDESLLDDFSA